MWKDAVLARDLAASARRSHTGRVGSCERVLEEAIGAGLAHADMASVIGLLGGAAPDHRLDHRHDVAAEQ